MFKEHTELEAEIIMQLPNCHTLLINVSFGRAFCFVGNCWPSRPTKTKQVKMSTSNTKSRGKSQIIQLKKVLLRLLKSNKQSIEEMLGDGKNLVCFDLFTLKLH